MLKEQILGLAVKAISQAHEARERIKENLRSKTVQNYVLGFREATIWMVENQWRKLNKPDRKGCFKSEVISKDGGTSGIGSENKPSIRVKKPLAKKARKSSIKKAQEIGSVKAEVILDMLKNGSEQTLRRDVSIEGKKSLTFLIWALGQAEHAKIKEGISIHDVSALLYRTSKIQLYPINISRVIHNNSKLIKQAGQSGRTKTYLLTSEGQDLFRATFVQT